ncbi:MAG: RidA family protein [Gemmatimonadales bacterium]|nr:RidA family protein [Gemmatimonadales bacterium]
MRSGLSSAVLGALGFAVAIAACAPTPERNSRVIPPDLRDVERVNAPTVPSLDGFSQAVKAGTTLYVSGQVALDSAGRLVGGSDLRAQLDQALRNLGTVLTASRALPADIVRITVYVVNYAPADYAIIRDVLTHFTPDGSPPALTLVGVDALPVSGLRVAIDAVAHVRGQFIDRERLPGRGMR